MATWSIRRALASRTDKRTNFARSDRQPKLTGVDGLRIYCRSMIRLASFASYKQAFGSSM
jgi:hypothetical protein